MNTEQPTQGRRVLRRYSAEDREHLIKEYQESGMTRKAFCEQRELSLTTFHGWFKKAKKVSPSGGKASSGFAEVAANRRQAPIEIELPGGKRLGFCINDEETVVRLILGVLSCSGGA